MKIKLFSLIGRFAAGAVDPERSGSQPSTSVDPEGDGAKEGQGARFWCLWDRL